MSIEAWGGSLDASVYVRLLLVRFDEEEGIEMVKFADTLRDFKLKPYPNSHYTSHIDTQTHSSFTPFNISFLACDTGNVM